MTYDKVNRIQLYLIILIMFFLLAIIGVIWYHFDRKIRSLNPDNLTVTSCVINERLINEYPHALHPCNTYTMNIDRMPMLF